MKTQPKILITNDDGIYAPGIFALWEAMDALGDVVVVAPDTEKSAVGHAITISDPIRIQEITRREGFKGYAVKGTPADCVKIAVQGILDSPPDIVISGINAGANVGNNIIYSGTVSAATEGTMLKIPSIAISLDAVRGGNYEPAKTVAQRVVHQVLDRGLPEGVLLNVNVPNIPITDIQGIKITKQGNIFFKDWFEGREDPRGHQYYWMTGKIVDPDSDENCDGVALSQGYVSITPIHYQLTCESFLEPLEQWTFDE